ncbi:MAG: efflux RND transporter periplasmic adaptor subunit [Gammaproteobacteria bacterium]|nr:efflux RND transporter periplasmic adaptor subunit [Gammaproteobacteria bacterium]
MKYFRHVSVASVVLCLVTLAGCSGTGQAISTVTVESKNHTFEVVAKGEIMATEEVRIGVPSGVNMSFEIQWLIPEYSEVSKGQVIATFDDAVVLTEIEKMELQMDQQELEYENFIRNNQTGRTQISHNSMRVDGETEIAVRYEDIDTSAFSQQEIIDALENIEYLEVQDQFYEWQADSHERRVNAESQKLQADLDITNQDIERNQKALEVMQLKSPDDGTFVYAHVGWGNQKVAPGQTMWPGRRIGSLPVRGKVNAEIHVLEVDAVGIEEGQKVNFRIDSDVTREFTGVVTDVQRMARSLDREDPTKYRIVRADFDNIEPDLMRVGSSFTATIITGQLSDVILVPQHAVFFDQDKPYVWVYSDGPEPEMRHIELGRRSPTLVEITSGLISGEKISLIAPATASV